MKKIFCILLAYFSVAQTFAVDAETAFGVERVTDNLRLGWDDLLGTIDNILWYIIWLFYFIAIIFAVYAWFTILTSAWDDEKVKKGKKIFLYVLAWLILTLLASQIITLVITVLTAESSGWQSLIDTFIFR